MSRLIFSAALVAIFAGQSAYGQDLKFRKGQAAVGQRKVVTEEIRTETDIEVKSNGQVMQTMNSKRDEDKKTVITVLSTKDGAIGSVKVEVKLWTIKEDGSRGERDIPDDLAGKTFILKKSGDEVLVTDAAGKAVEEGLAKEARRQFKSELDDQSRLFERILAGKSVSKGQSMKVPDAVARSLFLRQRSGQKELKVKACSITLKETTNVGDRLVAVFDMVLKMSGSPNKTIDIDLDFKGQVHVAVNGCWTYAMKLKGPVTISGGQNQGGMKIEFEGLGKMKLAQKTSFSGGKKATSKKPKLY
ncbi:MAG: hypothetical protein P1V97_36840 [Planctomycetota bacterium]|nr:hypothetical protein [Planctomycetota bacterium]